MRQFLRIFSALVAGIVGAVVGGVIGLVGTYAVCRAIDWVTGAEGGDSATAVIIED